MMYLEPPKVGRDVYGLKIRHMPRLMADLPSGKIGRIFGFVRTPAVRPVTYNETSIDCTQAKFASPDYFDGLVRLDGLDDPTRPAEPPTVDPPITSHPKNGDCCHRENTTGKNENGQNAF